MDHGGLPLLREEKGLIRLDGLWRKEVIPGSRKEEKDMEEKERHREGRGGKKRGGIGENNDCYSVLPKQGMPVSGVQRRARD